MNCYLKHCLTFTLLWLVFQPTNVGAKENTKGPFDQFLGQWTLVENDWSQRWDRHTTQDIKIKNHYTLCTTLNTVHSILCSVESPDLQGHIIWTLDPITQQVHHLSSFGTQRTGVGEGTIDSQGNLKLIISFASEGPNTYREYVYEWQSANTYKLISKQFENGINTTNFYSGNFVRIEESKKDACK